MSRVSQRGRSKPLSANRPSTPLAQSGSAFAFRLHLSPPAPWLHLVHSSPRLSLGLGVARSLWLQLGLHRHQLFLSLSSPWFRLPKLHHGSSLLRLLHPEIPAGVSAMAPPTVVSTLAPVVVSCSSPASTSLAPSHPPSVGLCILICIHSFFEMGEMLWVIWSLFLLWVDFPHV